MPKRGDDHPMSERGGASLTVGGVASAWWPLAASWLMMGFELPAVSATLARLPDPEISLAAYGGVVFPVALLIEAPSLMLLAASTELSRDRPSYVRLRRFTLWAAGLLTLVHLSIPLTPLYDLLVGRLIGPPAAVLEPARLGLLVMTPWTGCIAIRRFQQGVLIRFGRSRTIGLGTAVRLVTNVTVLLLGMGLGITPGILVGTSAIAFGVIAEAIFVALATRTVVRDDLPDLDPRARTLDLRGFLRFYVPLAVTPVLALAALPIGSAAMSRMPRALESLAVWPVINGLTFTLRSLGFAFNEVVVSRLEGARSVPPLFRFTLILAGVTSAVMVLIAATPLAAVWFRGVSGLSAPLADLARTAIWVPMLAPAISVFQSWYQGILVSTHRTRNITEAVAIYLGVAGAIFGTGIAWAGAPGIFVGVTGTVVGMTAQTAWLGFRARRALPEVLARPEAEGTGSAG